MEQIGDKIRKIRGLKGISQEYLAQQIGISQNSLSKIEVGETKLNVERLSQIAQALSVTPEEILNFNEKVAFSNHNAINEKGIPMNDLKSVDARISLYEEEIRFLKEQCAFYKSILSKNNLL